MKKTKEQLKFDAECAHFEEWQDLAANATYEARLRRALILVSDDDCPFRARAEAQLEALEKTEAGNLMIFRHATEAVLRSSGTSADETEAEQFARATAIVKKWKDENADA